MEALALCDTPARNSLHKQNFGHCSGSMGQASYRDRLPASLDDLTGPNHGTIQLPLHIAWSGLTAIDVNRRPLRMSMYHIILAKGCATT